MAQSDVEAVIHKAMTDPAFSLRLSKNFEGAIAAHDLDLTSDEQKALKGVNWKNVGIGGGKTAAGWVHIYSTKTAGGGNH